MSVVFVSIKLTYTDSILKMLVDVNLLSIFFFNFISDVQRKVIMSTFDRVKELADKRRISIVEVEEAVGFSKNSMYSWKKNKPSADKLEAVADYFNVSTDYLLGRTDNPYAGLSDSKKDLTVEEAIESVISYKGSEVTENDREILKGIVKAYLDGKL